MKSRSIRDSSAAAENQGMRHRELTTSDSDVTHLSVIDAMAGNINAPQYGDISGVARAHSRLAWRRACPALASKT